MKIHIVNCPKLFKNGALQKNVTPGIRVTLRYFWQRLSIDKQAGKLTQKYGKYGSVVTMESIWKIQW